MKVIWGLAMGCLFIFFSCATKRQARKMMDSISLRDSTLQVREGTYSYPPVEFRYIGCGGMMISRGEDAILLDPYFTNTPIGQFATKKATTDTAVVNHFFQGHFPEGKDIAGKIKAILITHTHYDHIADIPTVFLDHLHHDSAHIYGCETGVRILNSVPELKNATSVQAVDSMAYYPLTNRPGEWIYTSNRQIRFLPISTAHSPHFMRIKLMGSTGEKKNFDTFPKKAPCFPEGKNFAYLIDFLDANQNIEMRVLAHAGAAAKPENGFPPKEILDKRKVDVALVCLANFNQMNKGLFPDKLLEFVHPSHVIFQHWENFFKPIPHLIKNPATVPNTPIRQYIENLKTEPLPPYSWTLPNPFVGLTVY